jgi:hypothetical protein
MELLLPRRGATADDRFSSPYPLTIAGNQDSRRTIAGITGPGA